MSTTTTAPTTDHDAAIAAQGARYAALAAQTEEARQALITLVKQELARGTSEVAVSRISGVSRKTVRAWAGKSPRRADA